MKHRFIIASTGLLWMACAHGKMGQVDKALARGAITRTTPIFVESISAEKANFSGDKAGDAKRVAEEKSAIADLYHKSIAEWLRKKGYQAKAVSEPVTSGIVITGHVTRFEHGSAAGRIFVGMGAGSSNMYANIKIEDRTKKRVLSEFEVIATSGGRGGFSSAGSFIDAHLSDGAEKVAEYISEGK